MGRGGGADGEGRSLVLIAPGSESDPDEAGSWRASVAREGNPGSTDALLPPANPLGDEDGNGVADLLDYALGNHLGEGPLPIRLTLEDHDIGGQLISLPTLTYSTSLGAEGALITVEHSRDLSLWQGSGTEVVEEILREDGRSLVKVRMTPPEGTVSPFFVRLRVDVR